MGPLAGIKIIEIASIGPGPFCGMMLADMGAEVIRVERADALEAGRLDPLNRNRRSLICDLKQPAGAEVVLRLVDRADGFFEGFRPGVVERLGIGPDVCLERNPRLVYGRMTGWGQDGPLADAAGHDINYIALTGALHAIGRRGEKPVPPLNLVGDFGGGGMLLAFGIVSALLNAQRTGEGQVIDAAMVDGSNLLMAAFHGFRAMGIWDDATGSNVLSGAAHYYDTYETRDGRYISIAAIEPKFYRLLIDKLGLDEKRFAPHVFDWQKAGPDTQAAWAGLKQELAAIFRRRTRDEWCEFLEGTDVCFAPVLGLSEVPEHPHNMERDAFIEVGGQLQPAPAPRFSATPAGKPQIGPVPGSDTRELMKEAGFADAEVAELLACGAVGDSRE